MTFEGRKAIANSGGGGMVINTGLVQKTMSGNATFAQGIAFDNTGTVSVEEGCLAFDGSVAQRQGNTLAGGTWKVGPSATLDFTTGSDITINQATVVLAGTDSQFARLNALEDNQGHLTLSGGRVFASAGMLRNEGTLSINSGAALSVSSSFTNEGTVSIGEAGSALTVDGDYTQGTSGRLSVACGGTSSAPLLQVAGAASMGGRFQLTLASSYLPRLGDSITVMDSASVSGRFTSYYGLRLSDDLVMMPSITNGMLLLTATSVPVGTDAHLRQVDALHPAVLLAGQSFAGLIGASGTGNHTTATVLDGLSSLDTSVQMSFFDGSAETPIDSGLLVSDIVRFSGSGTNRFVLQLDYNETLVGPDGNEAALYLSWLHGTHWVNAVEGDSDGGVTSHFVLGPYNPADDYALGTYGVDTINNRVWAVIDHNSDFAVVAEDVPEPSVLLYLAMALAATGLRRLVPKKFDVDPKKTP